MKEQTRFTRWVTKNSPRRGLICHFYIQEKSKLYYGKVDFAYFNLYSASKDWVIRGTKGHGISSTRGKKSQIPCLNCFEVDDNFCKSIKKYESEGSDQFEIGIIFNKRKFKHHFSVRDVLTNRPLKLPPPNKCHYYDNPRFRRVLYPFHYCKVVRVEIIGDKIFPGFGAIENDSIMGMLVKPQEQQEITALLNKKGLGEVETFAVL